MVIKENIISLLGSKGATKGYANSEAIQENLIALIISLI